MTTTNRPAAARTDHAACSHTRDLAGRRTCRAMRAAMAADPVRVAVVNAVAASGRNVLLPELV